MAADVLVIGAGPAGIACAAALQQAGIAYRVVDQSDVIASTWDSLYPALRLNTSRYFSHMPGQPFPREYGVFPTGKQYHAYLVDYVRTRNLHIDLAVRVEHVTPDGDGYRVRSNLGSDWYANVVLATGRFNQPYAAEIAALHAYTGTVMHAHDYCSPQPFSGQRVLVIGNGPSGLDISVDTGRHNAGTPPTLLSMRTGIKLRRRYPLGLSKHAWMLIAERLPKPLALRLLNWASEFSYPARAKRGIRVPTAQQFSTAAGYRGPELIHAVRDGQVICVGRVLESDGQCIRLETLEGGSALHEVDVVILATGYRAVMDFLDPAIRFDTDREAWPLRYSSQVYNNPPGLTYGMHGIWDAEKGLTQREVKGYPGLFITGTFYQGKGAMHNFNVDSAIIAAQIGQRLQHIKQRQAVIPRTQHTKGLDL